MFIILHCEVIAILFFSCAFISAVHQVFPFSPVSFYACAETIILTLATKVQKSLQEEGSVTGKT